MKKESEKRRLPPEEIEAIRRQRANDPERIAWRKALAFFPLIRDIGSEISNKDQASEKVLGYHFIKQSPIPFVGFWGEGGKENLDKEDQRYLEKLLSIRKIIANHHEYGSKIHIILADKHGVFNGFYRDPDSSLYLPQVKLILQANDISVFSLEELYRKYNLQLPNISDPINVLSPEFDVFNKHKDIYIRHAVHNQGGEDSKRVANNYVRMRLNERQMLQQEFPNSFLLVNGTKMVSEPLLPTSMPIIYLSVGPVWFRNS